MTRFLTALVIGLSTFGLLAAAEAKGKREAAAKEQKEEGGEQQEQVLSYKPFPHNHIFNLKDINGKAPPADIWIRIDSTMRGSGFSGCKSWSGVFVVGANRLGPKAMPAVADAKCDPALQAVERDFWQVMLSGPFWDTQGSDLILKGAKGGVLRFSRSL
ncbi:META domain-containing protein [Methylosinus sp. Sm6]|uniref:META domain-containing protein n=1 Tax=Methylosinus sp. Sm6 TaxID=2866948 RepID=UPI001C99A113|nr:META domain-containing protein [Methylosinus sp. Sm6]MBY6241316.1 META domain-containing protein [Methylosinus sp. Sm6]